MLLNNRTIHSLVSLKTSDRHIFIKCSMSLQASCRAEVIVVRMLRLEIDSFPTLLRKDVICFMYDLHTSDCLWWCLYRALLCASSGTMVSVEKESVFYLSADTFITVISCLQSDKYYCNKTVCHMYDSVLQSDV